METTFQNYLQLIQESKNYNKDNYVYEEGEMFDKIYQTAAGIVTAGTFTLFPAFLAFTLIANGLGSTIKFTNEKIDQIKPLTQEQFKEIQPKINKFIKVAKDENAKKAALEYIKNNGTTLNPNIVSKTIKGN